MKARFNIYPERKLIVVRFTGPTIYEDIVQWFSETVNHPDFSREFSGLVDLRKALLGTVDRKKPRKMVEKARALAAYMTEIDFTSAKWAILVDAPIETSLVIMYSKDASQKHPLEIFSTVDAAEKYLGLPLADALQDLSA